MKVMPVYGIKSWVEFAITENVLDYTVRADHRILISVGKAFHTARAFDITNSCYENVSLPCSKSRFHVSFDMWLAESLYLIIDTIYVNNHYQDIYVSSSQSGRSLITYYLRHIFLIIWYLFDIFVVHRWFYISLKKILDT